MKKIQSVLRAPPMHWVGNGFAVRSLFSYHEHGQQVSPFLLLDYAAPRNFDPAASPRGVGEHPHRGFETVTIVYAGEVSHRDSSGGGGTIRPGDVQWMTAGAGLVHDEFHSAAFSEVGGPMEMVQLWVNLPSEHKMTAPKYQTLTAADIPVVDLPDGAGSARVIAGAFGGRKGPASTFTPVDVVDLRLADGARIEFPSADGHRLVLVVLRGGIRINDEQDIAPAQAAVFATEGVDAIVEASGDTVVLALGGQPIDEPIVGYGPFVMNTEQEIHQAIVDFNSGKFGRLPVETGGNPS